MTAEQDGRGLRFDVLGPLRAQRDGIDVPLGGPKQRLVLALLLTASGRSVSTAQLVEGVWGEDASTNAKKALQVHVHRLRAQLGTALLTDRDGYGLAAVAEVDAEVFLRVRQEALDFMPSDPATASDMLREALAMWRGPPYADVSEAIALAPEIARLNDVRTEALENRIEADLALGRHTGLIGELEGLTREFPLRDGFRAQHMTALYRAGRHVEALRSYERHRRHLSEEFGIEPSAELRSLESRILAEDAELKPTRVAESNHPDTVRGYELRELMDSRGHIKTYRAYQRTVGRQVLLRELGARLADDPMFIATFLRDTQRVAALEHPNIRYIFDTWREPGRAFQVSRWLGSGSTGSDLMGPNMSQRKALRVLDEVGSALGHAHRSGVLHGAIGLSSITVDDSGHAYLGNFVVGGGDALTVAGDRRDFIDLAHLLLSGSPPLIRTGARSPALDGIENGTPLAVVFDQAFSESDCLLPELFTRRLRQACGVDSSAFSSNLGERKPARNPYKGLQAFQEEDGADFFGRADVVERMRDRLTRNRLIAIVGPSGSGKSSAVKAGLIPVFRSNAEEGRTLVSEMFPGAYPFEELEDALLRVAVHPSPLVDELVGDDQGLVRAAKKVLPPETKELILVIDQFEELFSMVGDEQTRSLFLRNVVAAATDPDCRVRFVLTMRADFFDKPLEYPMFGELVESGLIPLTTPDEDSLAQAVTEPARSVGVEFEEGLTEQIVQDVANQPGSLPLLQHALTELFESRESDVITLATYRRGGGVFGAVGRRAELVFTDLPAPSQQAIRHAFLQMVAVGEGADDLRRRVRRSELESPGIDARSLDQALQVFGSHRLLTFDLDPVTSGPTVEVAHEALLREWPRLRSWVEDQRGNLIVRKNLGQALKEWKQSGEDSSYLPMGGRLAQFDDWAAHTSLSLTTEERRFLEAGAVKKEELLAEQEKQRRKELQHHARVRRLAKLTAVVAVLALLAGAFAAVQQGRASARAEEAELARFDAETRRIAASAPTLSATNVQLALLLAAEAYRRDPGPESLGALYQVFASTPGIHGYLGHGREFRDVVWLSDSTLAAAHTGGVDLYDTETAQRSGEFALSNPTAVISDPATGLMAVSAGSSVVVLDQDLRPQFDPLLHTSPVTSLAFGGSGSLLVGDRDGTVTSWSTSGGTKLASFAAHPERSMDELGLDGLVDGSPHLPESFGVGAVAVASSPDGSVIATAGLALVRLWDLEATAALRKEIVLTRDDAGGPSLSGARSVRISANQTVQVATVSLLYEFNLQGEEISRTPIPQGRIASSFRAIPGVISTELRDDGILTAVFGASVTKFWSDASRPAVEMNGRIRGFPSVAASPDGSRVAVAAEGAVVIMAFDGSNSIARSVAVSGGIQAEISNSGSLLAVSEPGSEASEFYDLSLPPPRRLFPTADPEPTFAFLGLPGDLVIAFNSTQSRVFAMDSELDYLFDYPVKTVGVLQVSPDAALVAFTEIPEGGRPHRDLIIADSKSGNRITELNFPEGVLDADDGIVGVSFNPDSTRVAASSALGAAWVFDLQTGQMVEPQLSFGGGQVVRARYSPDGRWLVTISSRGEIVLRDPTNFQPVGTVVGNADLASSGDGGPFFASDGRTMMTTFGGSVRLWDLESLSQIGGTIETEVGTTARASWNAEWVATFREGRVMVWNMDIEAWPTIACRAAGRNMTRAEWAQFGPQDESYRATCEEWVEE